MDLTKLPRFPDQIIGSDAHAQLALEGWAVVRTGWIKELQEEIRQLKAKPLPSTNGGE